MPTESQEQIQRLIRRNERRISSAFRSVALSSREADITPQLFRPLTNSVSNTFEEGLSNAVAFLDRNDIVVDIGAIRTSSQSQLQANNLRLTRNISNDLISIKQRNINPNYIGLTQRQVQTAENLRQALQTQNRQAVRRLWQSRLMDRRFNSSIQSFLDGGDAPSQQTIGRIINSYSNRALNYRGFVIGQTESTTAINYAREQTFTQAIREGNDITEIWRTAGDGSVRDSHASINGQSRNDRGVFVTGAGNTALYPGDPSLPASDRVNCRCTIIHEVN